MINYLFDSDTLNSLVGWVRQSEPGTVKGCGYILKPNTLFQDLTRHEAMAVSGGLFDDMALPSSPPPPPPPANPPPLSETLVATGPHGEKITLGLFVGYLTTVVGLNVPGR